MVNNTSPQLNRTFAALSDPTRRAILARLASGSASVTELARPFEISLPAISKHLRVLEKAGLLVQRKEGRTRQCSLRATPLRQASVWIDRYRNFWEGQLEALGDYLTETPPRGDR